jgi:hypothetical protein
MGKILAACIATTILIIVAIYVVAEIAKFVPEEFKGTIRLIFLALIFLVPTGIGVVFLALRKGSAV